MYADQTAGHSGTDTSAERAERERDDGTLSKRLSNTLAVVERAGASGVTWTDLARFLGLHHGSASSALTNLHMQGRIARTARRRDGSKVYVTPDNAREDDTLEPYVRRGQADQQRIAALQDRIDRAFMALMEGNSAHALAVLSEES
jgi:DNA-binding MarR family transcriptional regulator